MNFRKTGILGTLILMCAGSYAQNESDIIRYAFQTTGSTARSYAAGGAFGAVGADPSCASINPAGMARYRNNFFNISAGFFTIKNNAAYINSTISDSKFNFNLPNIGFVINIPAEDFENKKPEGFVNFVLGFNVNRLNNYHRRTIFEANNSSSSITQNWADRATRTQSVPDDFYRYSLELLAYNAWLIDKDTLSPIPAYVSAYGKGAKINVKQIGNYLTRGALNDYNFSAAANYQHVLFVGIALGFKNIRYIQENNFMETDLKPITQGRDIKSAEMDQYQRTTGMGLNAKLGINIAPSEYVRFGYAFHSPSIFSLTDKYAYKITSQFDPGATDQFGDLRKSSSWSTDTVKYKYKITVPGRHIFSVAAVNKNIGFLSLDLETVNYTQGNLKGSDYAFNEENLIVKKSLRTGAVNVRLGGELIEKQYRIRAGYAYSPSPYKNGAVPFVRDLASHTFSAGFGIKTKMYGFDIAFVRNIYSDYYVPYTSSAGESYTITNDLSSNNIVVSASFLLE